MLDNEATSSVDTRTEQAIARAMDTLMGGRTSFVIEHGTHDELLAKGGAYARLYESQFA